MKRVMQILEKSRTDIIYTHTKENFASQVKPYTRVL